MNRVYRIIWEKINEHHARILRVYGNYNTAVIPNQIEGFTVTEIGDYCFSQSERLSNENNRETILNEENKDIVEDELLALAGEYLKAVELPISVKKIGNYSFYNCRKLERLTLGKNCLDVGSDAFMNCRHLKRIDLVCKTTEQSGIKQILSQITWDLDVCFVEEEACTAKVFFPEYTESYDEIAPAHIFGRNIEGEGFRARQSFVDGVLNFWQYDQIFPQACVDEKEKTLLKIVVDRLCYPVSLGEQEQKRYEKYANQHGNALMESLIAHRDLRTLHLLCEKKIITESALNHGITVSSASEWAEGAASLIQWKQDLFVKHEKDRYSFDEF